MMRKSYTIRRILFYQEALSYDDFVASWEITRGKWQPVTAEKQSFASWIDGMIKAGTLPQLAQIVLKLDDKTPLHWIWNRFWLWRAKGKNGTFGKVLSLDPIFSSVIRDFFFINVSWIEMWLDTPLGSDLNLKAMTARQVISLVKSFFTAQVAGASKMPAPLEGSAQSESSTGA